MRMCETLQVSDVRMIILGGISFLSGTMRRACACARRCRCVFFKNEPFQKEVWCCFGDLVEGVRMCETLQVCGAGL